MNRNQKIAIGCGGAGCLGLIVLVIAVGLIYWLWRPNAPARNRDYDYSANANRNSNSKSEHNSPVTTNENASPSSSDDSAMSEEDKHRLFQAASMSTDPELVHRVGVKIGILNEDFTPEEGYVGFVRDHVSWALRSGDFIQSINTPEKARAYVNQHMSE